MRRIFVASVLAVSMMVGGTAVAAVRSEKVIGGRGNQYWPTSNGEHVAFTEYRRRVFDIFVSRLGATARTRINANDEQAAIGTLMAGTDQVVFQQFQRNRSDLYFYDISSKRRWLVQGRSSPTSGSTTPPGRGSSSSSCGTSGAVTTTASCCSTTAWQTTCMC